MAGGSLCFPSENLKTFMKGKESFFHYNPTEGRETVPPHIKTYTRAIPLVPQCTGSKKRKMESEETNQDDRKQVEKEKTTICGLGSDNQGTHLPTGYELPWVILTSSNLSKAAWGCLQKGETQLLVRHYEVGILFHPSFCLRKVETFRSSLDMTIQQDVINFPLPYSLPLHPYDKGDEPWVWNIPYSDTDIYGNVWPQK
eukprot:TRINITY_DN3831_c0_g1_i14.p1 TRINITY_DN3831_c0_g1~~TRINITY_DN3831_c0_g1_i14.p1  ORF type:complete len:199 (-),score=52.87 TRINITY_DN3831_c0_g1_i14:155-751(-)